MHLGSSAVQVSRLFLLISISLFLSIGQIADAKTRKKRRSKKSQVGIVAVEGVIVYKKADFDATIVDYLTKGKKYRISRRTYEGAGGLGVFYKVRVRKKVFGYIADNEIIPKNKAGAVGAAPKSDKSAPNPVFDQVIDINEGVEPMYYRKYWGINVNYTAITEKFEGKTLNSFEPQLGFKMTGPGVLFDGPPVDLEINIGFQPPSYYLDKFASEASGYYSIGSLMLVNPLSDSKLGMMYYGFGLHYNFTAFKIKLKNDSAETLYDSQKLTAGVVFSLGYAFNLGNHALRLETKYHYDDQQYLGLGLSYQFGMK